jgi:predicted dienelactone hydrolase
MWRWFVAALLACSTACQPGEPLPFAPASIDAAPDPAALGPYPVGVRTETFVDTLRIDPDTGAPRTLVTEIWYPAVEAARAGPFQDYVLYDRIPEDLRGDLKPEDLGTLHTLAVRDAAPRDDGVTFPVVVFSHGKGGLREQSTYFTVYLASHGYVVAAPDHAGDTTVDLLRELVDQGEIQQDSVMKAMAERPADVVALLDLLRDTLTEDDPLRAILDFERVGCTGHSFGALTSLVAATIDTRIDAVVAQAPTSQEVVQLQSSVMMEDMPRPALIQSASLDRTLPEDTNARPLVEHLPAGQTWWLSLAQAGHFTYSDLCVLDVEAIDEALAIDVSHVLTDGCGPENVATDVAFPAIRKSAIGFLNMQLRGSAASKQYLSQEALDGVAPDLGTFTAK